MTAPTEPPVFAAVVEFFAAAGNGDRYLAAHTARPDGRCAGCWPAEIQHPCPLHPLAVEGARRAHTVRAAPAPRRPRGGPGVPVRVQRGYSTPLMDSGIVIDEDPPPAPLGLAGLQGVHTVEILRALGIPA